jgi:hypothetical protein
MRPANKSYNNVIKQINNLSKQINVIVLLMKEMTGAIT